MKSPSSHLIDVFSRKEMQNRILDYIERCNIPLRWNENENRFLIGKIFEYMFPQLNNKYDTLEGGFQHQSRNGYDVSFKVKNEPKVRLSVKTRKDLLQSRKNNTKDIILKNFQGNATNYSYEWDVLACIGRRSEKTDFICFGAISRETAQKISPKITSTNIILNIPIDYFGNTFCQRKVDSYLISSTYEKNLFQMFSKHVSSLMEDFHKINNESFNSGQQKIKSTNFITDDKGCTTLVNL